MARFAPYIFAASCILTSSVAFAQTTTGCNDLQSLINQQQNRYDQDSKLKSNAANILKNSTQTIQKLQKQKQKAQEKLVALQKQVNEAQNDLTQATAQLTVEQKRLSSSRDYIAKISMHSLQEHHRFIDSLNQQYQQLCTTHKTKEMVTTKKSLHSYDTPRTTDIYIDSDGIIHHNK